MATNGFKYSLVIQEIYQKLKSIEKHGGRENIHVSEAFEIVNGIMNNNAVYLDDHN